MAYEVIYVCNSINNKNVREGELNILKKYEEQLYFVFGSDEMNTKKRFYNNLETLNKDFDALLKLKEKEKEEKNDEENKTIKLVKEINENINMAYKEIEPVIEKEPEKIVEEEAKKESKKTLKEEKASKYKIIKRKK